MYNQSQNWRNIIEKEKLPLFIIGDFNQCRFNNQGYGTVKVRQILTELLNELDLNCVTEIDFSERHLTEDPIKKKIRNNIDHICVSNEFLKNLKNIEVGAWNHFTENGIFMSDHNGVYIDFKI